jgi:predicted membrane protein
MKKDGFDKIGLRKFAINTFLVLFIVASIMLVRHKQNYVWFYLLGTAIILLYLLFPALLNLIYFIVKKIVFLFGWLIGNLVLLLFFYVIFTPLGLAMRMFKKDLLDRKIEKDRKSYWKEEEKKEFRPLSYERQF